MTLICLARKKFPELGENVMFFDDTGSLLDEEVLGVYILSASMNDPLIQIRQTASQDDANTSTASTTSIIEVTSPSEETECDTDDANVCIIHINIFKM